MNLVSVIPKLPMRDKMITAAYYDTLGFSRVGTGDFEDYLMLQKDAVELHFFVFQDINPQENYGQVYVRVDDIRGFYNQLLEKNIKIHPNGSLTKKPWGQAEFSLLDPDHNLLTFGEAI